MTNQPLVEIKDLKKYFPVPNKQVVRAVDGVSLTINRGETLGLVGESGCGKTTVGRCILRLMEPTSGEIRFDGRDLLKLGRGEMRLSRRRMQIIFQDPYSSLNPRMKVGSIIAEPLEIHRVGDRRERKDRVAELLRVVGLDPDYANRYPHQFSGGQRQRIGIARALALNPDFIVADEPVSALDVSVQAQVVNLMQDLQERFGLTYLFISHGLAVVKHISTRVGVMYLGKLVELAPAQEIYTNPLHPYTQALLRAIPVPDPDAKRRMAQRLGGDVPNPIAPPGGCRFHTRCPQTMERCGSKEPELAEVSPGHFVACFLHEQALQSPRL
ncbi:MAG TPA: dipeptide ABC transporter ATP-binding protein [Blastocatellia bacterium]|jgi:oligopeptide/dipeptide ABC transporter ATP-binding protein|nr:dipeptide ABC transporter ATP-binding protein [Blastocatellia bacterium]